MPLSHTPVPVQPFVKQVRQERDIQPQCPRGIFAREVVQKLQVEGLQTLTQQDVERACMQIAYTEKR